jgi:hemerythrin-like domain-containing protein
MMPIGPLMIEHRLIERMVSVLQQEMHTRKDRNEVNIEFIDSAVDFFRTYGDHCHHGKEEDILFKDLAGKQLSPDLHKIMEELIQEHRFGRELVGKLANAREHYVQGEKGAQGEIINFLKELTEFYPLHIEKEDKRFFMSSMEYLSKEEQNAMLQEFAEFDKRLIHKKYKQLVEQFEGKK